MFYRQRLRAYHRLSLPILGDRAEPPIGDVLSAGSRYLPPEFAGEAILTVGRAVLMIERDGVDAVINASPLFCMPGTITAAIFPQIEEELGAPILSLFYEGSGDPNRALVPHMHYLVQAGSDALARRGSAP